jgi:hypothetical protein
MTLVEVDHPRDIQGLLPKTAESPEPAFLYDQHAAKALASEFLLKRPQEIALKQGYLDAEDSYFKGRMDVRAMILTMIGQVHILALNVGSVDHNDPPMTMIQPVSSAQIDLLLTSYQEARQYLIDHNFHSKPITKISPEEGYAKGKIMELGKSLVNLGQREALQRIDHSPKIDPQSSGNGELQ